jgi:hypothetical protein
MLDGIPLKITRTSSVFVPRGMKHGPLTWKRFSKPHLEMAVRAGRDREIPHTHEFDEVIGFAGTNRNYPWELGGELEFLMGGSGTPSPRPV